MSGHRAVTPRQHSRWTQYLTISHELTQSVSRVMEPYLIRVHIENHRAFALRETNANRRRHGIIIRAARLLFRCDTLRSEK